MEVADSKFWRRDFAEACWEGSKRPLPKNSSEEMPFWVPNLERAYWEVFVSVWFFVRRGVVKEVGIGGLDVYTFAFGGLDWSYAAEAAG